MQPLLKFMLSYYYGLVLKVEVETSVIMVPRAGPRPRPRPWSKAPNIERPLINIVVSKFFPFFFYLKKDGVICIFFIT